MFLKSIQRMRSWPIRTPIKTGIFPRNWLTSFEYIMQKRHAVEMNQKYSSLITFSPKHQSISGLCGDECFLTHHHSSPFPPVSQRSCVMPVTFPTVVFVITSLETIITRLVIIISRLVMTECYGTKIMSLTCKTNSCPLCFSLQFLHFSPFPAICSGMTAWKLGHSFLMT